MTSSNNKELIIPGYHGIMDLDLTNIPEHFHKETIALHQKDIDKYKEEQNTRPEHLRYEYVMKRVNRMIDNHCKLIQKTAQNMNTYHKKTN